MKKIDKEFIEEPIINNKGYKYFFDRLIKLLEQLNKKNYNMLNIGLYQKVDDNERMLYNIEKEMFGNTKIQAKQEQIWREKNEKNK